MDMKISDRTEAPSGRETGEALLNRIGDAGAFIAHALDKLRPEPDSEPFFPNPGKGDAGTAAVLFPLGARCFGSGFEPCLVLNKRSAAVTQPGDLCCPGGRVAPGIDTFLSRLLPLPWLPLRRWPHWTALRRAHPVPAGRMATLLATSLRESFEEMRLNPMGVRFLGPLPVQQLVMYPREIYPMVGWIVRQKRFFPNWEVEKIVRVPIRSLLDPANYARYRLRVVLPETGALPQLLDDYPCFRHRTGDESELLWGVTYRLTVAFLETVFDFKPPELHTLPVVTGILDERYVRNGKLDGDK